MEVSLAYAGSLRLDYKEDCSPELPQGVSEWLLISTRNVYNFISQKKQEVIWIYHKAHQKSFYVVSTDTHLSSGRGHLAGGTGSTCSPWCWTP
jgi:hypothetical protein